MINILRGEILFLFDM